MAGLGITDVEDRKIGQGGRRQVGTRLKGTYEKAIGDNVPSSREGDYHEAATRHILGNVVVHS
jgi:hypothetical protein